MPGLNSCTGHWPALLTVPAHVHERRQCQPHCIEAWSVLGPEMRDSSTCLPSRPQKRRPFGRVLKHPLESHLRRRRASLTAQQQPRALSRAWQKCPGWRHLQRHLRHLEASASRSPCCSRAHHVVGETWLCRSCCPGPTRSLRCTTCHAFRDTTLAHNGRRSNSRSNLHCTTAVHCLVDSLGRCPQRDSHKTRLSWEAVLLANDLPLLTRPLQPAALDKLQSWRR